MLKKLRILILTGLVISSAASAGDVLVYTGGNGTNEGYSDFGVATGKPVVIQNVFPEDLSPYDCVLLSVNRDGFSGATLTALDGYVNAGGRILAIGEWDDFAGGANGAMNTLSAFIGAELAIIPDFIDAGLQTTFNIDPSNFTEGVTSIVYGATSEVQVAVGPNAQSLVRTIGGTTFIGVDKVGAGVYAMLGDSNVFSDNSGDGYTAHDNGVLAANLCDQANFEIEVAIDIKFCSDPNAFNCKKKGVLPVTIFGTDTFDVADIDVSTLQLCTEDLSECTGAPWDYSIADRGDPDSDLGAAQCALLEVDEGIFEEQDYLTLDGFLDLDAAFDAREVQAMLGDFCGADKGAISETLVIIGSTLDGTPIISVPVDNLGIDQLLKQNK